MLLTGRWVPRNICKRADHSSVDRLTSCALCGVVARLTSVEFCSTTESSRSDLEQTGVGNNGAAELDVELGDVEPGVRRGSLAPCGLDVGTVHRLGPARFANLRTIMNRSSDRLSQPRKIRCRRSHGRLGRRHVVGTTKDHGGFGPCVTPLRRSGRGRAWCAP